MAGESTAADYLNYQLPHELRIRVWTPLFFQFMDSNSDSASQHYIVADFLRKFVN